MRRLLALILTSVLVLGNSSFAALAAELPAVAGDSFFAEDESEVADAVTVAESTSEKNAAEFEEIVAPEETEKVEEVLVAEKIETEPAYQQLEEAVEEEEEIITPASYLLEDEDILLEQYIEETAETLVEEALYGEVEETLPPTYARYWKLNDAERKAYLILKGLIEEVASGEVSQASVRFTYANIFPEDLLNKKFTAEDLGLESLAEEGTTTPSTAAKAALEAKFPFNTGKIMTALLRDCPSQLYWFDKTVGMSTAYTLGGYSWEIINNKVATISMSPKRFYQMSFNVSSDYQDEDTEKFFTDTDMTGSVTTSIEKAAQIVTDENADNDYEKLIAYRDIICDLVSYNTAAADKSTNTAYGNPWQLIYVFDGDATTNVVCEGYAKAYKFLCDLSSFRNTSISCSIVSGQMSGGTGAGGHMWNLVSVNGKNYLVDVTNCDSGTIGYPDKLFMLGKDSYSTATVTKNGVSYESEKYTFPISSRNISYTYDVDTVTIFDQEERLLAASDYTYVPPIDISIATVTGVEDKYYTGSEITQTPTVTMVVDGETVTLAEGTDYTLSYNNNVNAGVTATMTISGKGNYTGIKTVTFDINKDTAGPAIDTTTFKRTDGNESVKPGEVVSYEVAVTDNVGVSYVYVNVSAPSGTNGDSRKIDLSYNSETGKYEGSLSITDNMVSGEWIFSNIVACDVNGNGSEVYRIGAPVNNSVPKADLSAGNFTVYGTVVDYTKPEIHTDTITLSPEQEKYTIGNTVKLSVKITDDIAMSDEANATYVTWKPVQGDSIRVYLAYNEDTDCYEGELEITNDIYSGTCSLYMIHTSDAAGNLNEVYMTGAPVSAPRTDLSAGNFDITGTDPDADLEAPVIDESSFKVTYPDDYDELGYALPGSIVSFAVKVTDNVGIDYVALAFPGPNGENYLTITLNDFDGDGTFTCDCYISPSMWTSSVTLIPGRIIARDTSGNERELTSDNSDIFADGKGTINIHIHALQKTEAKPAGCTEAGMHAYWTCKECGKLFSDEAATIETALEELITKALGHSYGAWQKLNNEQHQRVCSHDKTHTEKENHIWDEGVVTKAATYDAAGIKTFTCKLCLGTKTETIPKLPRISIAKAKVSGVTDRLYTGKAQTQSPVVKLGSAVLKSGTDYTLSYKNNTKVGTATLTVTGKGNYTGTVTKTFKITKKSGWKRLAGASGTGAFGTMEQITKEFGKADTAIVVTNADFKDALAAAALAGSYEAPILTTAKGSLSVKTQSELKRMGVKKVIIVGNTGDVSENTEKQIKALVSDTTRIMGSGAAGKSVNATKAIPAGRSNTVIIATQKSFKDAMSISSYAYASVTPIIYVESNLKLSDASLNYIKSAGFNQAIIVGGPLAIPTSVDTQLKGVGIAAGKVTRLAGKGCYGTSGAIAEWAMGKLKNGTSYAKGKSYQYTSVKFQPAVVMSANKVGISRGDGWKDALCGAALSGKNRAVILLADGTNSNYAQDVIKKYKNTIAMGYVYGGTQAVPKAVMTKLEKASK